MVNNLPKKPFSKRHGYHSQPKEITVREDAPENLRHFVLDTAVEIGLTPTAIRECICSVLHVRPDRNNWSEYPNVWEEAQALVYGCEWFKFYDFVERLQHSFTTGWEGAADLMNPETREMRFQDALNEFFVEEGIGWQVIDGEIVTRGTEAFEASIQSAVHVLASAGRTAARQEIHEALTDLSRRPDADLTGAVQHAMAALECVARDVCGDEHATLGEIIKKYPGTIPKPLDDSVSKAWGFASETARHVREGQRLERKEAELIVALAAIVSNYLSR